MISIYRFSKDGFIPKRQTYYLKRFDQIPEYYSKIPEGLNDYQISLWESTKEEVLRDFEKLNLEDFEGGVHVFLGSLPDLNQIRIMLNHLNQDILWELSLYKGEVEDDIFVYQTGRVIPRIFSIQDYLSSGYSGMDCYIPSKYLPYNWEYIEKKSSN